MPVRLTDFANKYRHLKVKWTDLEVTVTYDAAKLSVEEFLEMQMDLDKGETQLQKQVDFLYHVLTGWDIMQANSNGSETETPEPITKELLIKLPLPFLNAITSQVIEQENPPARKSGR